MNPTPATCSVPEPHYDVVVIGGAFSGASTALLLRRWLPDTRVLVVERREAFDWKVGEATVEISGMFLHRVLKLHDYLAREQLPKHGLRYWFHGGPDDTLAEMSEIGPYAVSLLPSFQLDRARLDETILAHAVQAGADLLRPARVQSVELGWPQSRLTLRAADGREFDVRCRWIIDASGRHNVIARRLDLLRKTEEHPTAAAWARWRNVADLDGPALMGVDPRSPRMPPLAAARRLATNHFCGYGYWAWTIPLVGGETSIGVVYDKRYFRWPSSGRPLEQYRHFVATSPGLRELVAGAELDESDFRGYAHLPYCTSRYADRGWALVGDAAAFIDPYYSPGLDHCSFSVYATVRLLCDELSGQLDASALERRVADHNDLFLTSYRRWLGALYLDKYEIMGDAELTGASFLVDTAMYYLGVVGPATLDIDEYLIPILGKRRRRVAFAYGFMSTFRRRMVHLARFRRAAGLYGRRNRGWKHFPRRFAIGRPAVGILAGGCRIWARAEAQAVWHRLRHGRVRVAAPSAAPGAATAPELAPARDSVPAGLRR